jgi:hypothetical protein
MAVALLALVIATAGTAVAATKLVSGDGLIKPASLSGNRLRNHTLTGGQINLNKLGTVPSAKQATTAATATLAKNATAAGTALYSTFASRLTGRGTFTPLPLAAGWTTAPSFTAPACYLDQEGFVHLQGAVAVAVTSGTGSIIGTLPPGFRPAGTGAQAALFTVVTEVGATPTTGIVGINASGQIVLTSPATPVGEVVSLEGIVFAQEN